MIDGVCHDDVERVARLAQRSSGVIMSPAEYEVLHRAEYGWLCKKLGLGPVSLFVTPTSDEEPEDPRYGGARRCIYIPFTTGDLEVHGASPTPDHGPPTWIAKSPEGWDYWAKWRTDLWHEVTHQVQDQILGMWNPHDGDDGHAEGWDEALAEVSRRLGDRSAVLKELLAVDRFAVAMGRALR